MGRLEASDRTGADVVQGLQGEQNVGGDPFVVATRSGNLVAFRPGIDARLGGTNGSPSP